MQRACRPERPLAPAGIAHGSERPNLGKPSGERQLKTGSVALWLFPSEAASFLMYFCVSSISQRPDSRRGA